MDVNALLSDVKAHLEQGAELLASHVPALVDLAAKIQADPFVELAINTALSPSGKAIAGDLIQRLEAFEREHAAAAAAAVPDGPPADAAVPA